MRLMAIMAHPDDAEIWCGGTLILHAESGDSVRICILTYDKDSQRGKEGQQSASRMGCDIEFLGLEDTEIRDEEEALYRLSCSLDSFRPDTIITHWYDDVHPDHESVFLLARRAYFRTYIRNHLQSIPRLFCCDTYNSQGIREIFLPDKLVDVSRVWEKKANAIQAHGSQPVAYYLEMINRQCLNHGKAAGVHLAEGFLRVPLVPESGVSLDGQFMLSNSLSE